MRKAIRQFELDQHHEKIYDDPNELIEAGFPADFLLPLISVYKSSDYYRYFRREEFVDEMIGISHLALIYAIADYLGVPEGTGSRFTGRGFAMRATIRAINSILSESSEPS
jgi:hypothetical protein|tara:strand:- start:468 stop:800 length:333 start_codon:yes stop_codon:yes gene_type:complete